MGSPRAWQSLFSGQEGEIFLFWEKRLGESGAHRQGKAYNFYFQGNVVISVLNCKEVIFVKKKGSHRAYFPLGGGGESPYFKGVPDREDLQGAPSIREGGEPSLFSGGNYFYPAPVGEN